MATKSQQARVECVECGEFIDPFRGFVCKSCKRRPLCQKHRDPRMRSVCVKCANQMRREKLAELRAGVRSMKAFLRFLQFLFLVFAALFAAQRLLPDAMPSYIAENVAFRYLYIPGILCTVGFVIVFVLYVGQKSSLKELEKEISMPGGFVPRAR